VFETPANCEIRYNLPGIGSDDEESANLELTRPKGSRRIVDETAGEVTFADHLLRIKAHGSQNRTNLAHHRSCSDNRRGYPH